MDDLRRALTRFNQAEPDLVVRDAFGHGGTPLFISDDFRARVAVAAGLKAVPADVWWAFEYPINCLAGALRLYVTGRDGVGDVIENLAHSNYRRSPDEPMRLVEGNREDFDLVMSFGTKLILIEAKAYGKELARQVQSKLARLSLLRKFYLALPGASSRPVSFHFVLASRTGSVALDVDWPTWACKGGKAPCMPLNVDSSAGILRVSRGTEHRGRLSNDRSWTVKRRT